MSLSVFLDGASYLISELNFAVHAAGRSLIGRPDGQFIVPRAQMDELLRRTSNPRDWEDELGLEPNSLGNNPIRVDINHPEQYNLRPATDPTISGAKNKRFLGTGKTPGGQDEANIDVFPNPGKNPEVGEVYHVYNPQEPVPNDDITTEIEEEEDSEVEENTEVEEDSEIVVDSKIEEKTNVEVNSDGEVTSEVEIDSEESYDYYSGMY